MTDLELVSSLCKEEEDEFFYEEFVNRFMKPLSDECKLLCKKRKIDPHIGKEIAHRTFERVKKYKSFDETKCSVDDPRKSILVWLFKISGNLFLDYHKSLKEEEPRPTYFDDFKERIDNISSEELHRKKGLAEVIMGSLNPKEQKVFLTDAEHKRLKKKLPQDINEALAEELGVKTDTIRKIRERAIKKVNAAIDKINEG